MSQFNSYLMHFPLFEVLKSKNKVIVLFILGFMKLKGVLIIFISLFGLELTYSSNTPSPKIRYFDENSGFETTNFISDIQVDSKGLVWIINFNGISVYDGNQFKNINTSTVSHGSLLRFFEGDEYQLIKIKEIIRIEGDGSYSKIITKSKVYLSSKRIGFFTSKISDERFFRCHNSHIINTNRIKKIGKGKSTYIVMENEDIVPVSPTKKTVLMKLLQM